MFKIKRAQYSPMSNHTAADHPQALAKTAHRSRERKLLTIVLLILSTIALAHFIAITHTAYPTLPITNCLDLIRHSDYTKFIQLHPGRQEMGAVQLVDQLLGGQPAALVPVIDTSPQHLLDLYVYGCILQQNSPSLTLLFKRQGLVQGTLNVANNTLSIGELDTTISPEKSVLLEPLQQNVYRDYIWNNNTFTQIIFSGLYPVNSRSEAEALQDQANNGQILPWSDPLVTTEQMARDLFHWSFDNLRTILQDNDKTTAHVLLVQQHPHIEVNVMLARLVQPDETGLWFVTSAQTRGLTLDIPDRHLGSPILLQGKGALSDGTTTATLFDHTFAPLHLLNKRTMQVTKTGAYTGSELYTSTIANQPGLLLIESLPSNDTKAGRLLLVGIILG